MTPAEVTIGLLIGAAGGLAGGLLGIGGSVVMIPALTFAFGPDQQRFQAAAMIINTAVAITATIRHGKAKVIRFDVARRVLPVALVAILAGVALSNRMDALVLQRSFGVFLFVLAAYEGWTLLRGSPEPLDDREAATWPRSAAAGGFMGLPAGLLGIGGGLLLVPALHRLNRLPLRQAIGTSSAVILVTAAVGAVAKNLNFGVPAGSGPVVEASRVLPLAAALLPGGVIGALVGATLTHLLPTAWVKMALVLLLLLAGSRMLGIG